MNRPSADLSPELLDRLVDAELSDRERRALLERLEREPDGWRRCALAFLEAQSLREELRALGCEPRPAAAAPPAVAKAARWSYTPRVWFSLAASFLLAFALGLALRGPSPAVRYAAGAAEPAEAVVEQPAPRPTEDHRPGDALAVADGVAGFDDFVLSLGDIEERYGISTPAVPPTVVRALQRMGHQVRQHRELLPIELEDGRRGWIPAERIELHYVGNQYQ